MDKQQVANLLQEQLEKIPPLRELNPDHPDFELWKEDCVTIFKEFFADERRFLNNFDWSSFRVNRIKYEEEVGIFTEEDKEAYLKGLQGAEVTIKAALRKLELFGVKPQIQHEDKKSKGITVQVTNNLTNQQSVNMSVTFDQIISTIQNSNYSEEEKQEATNKVSELKEELEKENPAWEKIKTILSWILNFSKEVFIQVLPYILEKYSK